MSKESYETKLANLQSVHNRISLRISEILIEKIFNESKSSIILNQIILLEQKIKKYYFYFNRTNDISIRSKISDLESQLRLLSRRLADF